MQSAQHFGRGALLIKTPSHRQQVSRRRLAVLCAVLALALGSGLAGSLIHPSSGPDRQPATGPFSYFPSE